MHSTPTEPMTTPSAKPLETVQPRRGTIDADALLRSLAPVVAKPEQKFEPKVEQTPAEAPKPRPSFGALAVEEEPEPKVRKPKPKKPKPAKPVQRWIPEDDDDEIDAPAAKPATGERRAKLDVAINPGEGTTAIYVRVPRTTHVNLKLLALQNQAAMEGPTELASIVRTAIDQYLARQDARRAA